MKNPPAPIPGAGVPQTPPTSKRWLTPTVVGVGLTSLFSDWSHELATALMPALLASLGAPPIALGLVEGLSDAALLDSHLLGCVKMSPLLRNLRRSGASTGADRVAEFGRMCVPGKDRVPSTSRVQNPAPVATLPFYNNVIRGLMIPGNPEPPGHALSLLRNTHEVRVLCLLPKHG